MTDLTPAKKQAKELMLRRYERIGMRYHQFAEEQYELLQERAELDDLWRLGGFGEPPEFRPSVGVAAGRARVTA